MPTAPSCREVGVMISTHKDTQKAEKNATTIPPVVRNPFCMGIPRNSREMALFGSGPEGPELEG